MVACGLPCHAQSHTRRWLHLPDAKQALPAAFSHFSKPHGAPLHSPVPLVTAHLTPKPASAQPRPAPRHRVVPGSRGQFMLRTKCPVSWVPACEDAVGRRVAMLRDLSERPLAESQPHVGPAVTGFPTLSPVPRLAAGADLLEEHLGEIRNLRQRLEESICINDRLREQLEHRLSSATRGSGRRPRGPVPGLTGSFGRVGPAEGLSPQQPN